MHLSLQILLGTLATLLMASLLWFLWHSQTQMELTRSLRNFLGISLGRDAHVASQQVAPCYLVDLVRATRGLLDARGLAYEELGVRGVTPVQGLSLFGRADLSALLTGTVSAGLGAPQLEKVPVGPEEEDLVPLSVFWKVSHPDHPLLVQTLRSEGDFTPATFEVACRGVPEAVALATQLFQEIQERAAGDSVYRGQLLRPFFGMGGKPNSITMEPSSGEDDPTLPAELRRELEEAYLGFKLHRETLEAQGIPTQRGLLLCGPPGTGKTSTCRYLKRRLPDHTFVSVPMASLGSLEEVFTMARRFTPAVILLDDVDLYARDREQSFVNGLLGELMTQMDGMRAREQVDVIMTSNSWKCIEEALALRPGRIDTVILYEKPGAEQRTRLLERFLADVHAEATIPELVELTEGFSPAQIRELTKRAVLRATMRRATLEHPVDPEDEVRVRRADFEAAGRALEGNPLLDRPKTARALRRREAPLLELRRRPPEDPPPASA